MNPRLAPAEVAHVLAHSGTTAVVADGDLVHSDLEAAGERLVVLIDAGTTDGAPAAGDSPTPLLGWAEATSGDRSAFQAPRQSDDLADILYTSGTTGRPKGVAVRHSNGSMIGAVEPNWTGGGWLHASPLFTFAGIALVYTPMKLGLQVDLPTAFRRRPLAARRRGAAPRRRLPRAGHGAPPHRPPTLRRGRLVLGADVLGGQRAAGPLRGRAAAGQDARRHRVEQLRHDRGGLRVLHHAQGRGGEAARLGRPDRRARRRADRRRAGPIAAARRGGGGAAADAGPPARVLRGPRGDGRDLAGWLADHG